MLHRDLSSEQAAVTLARACVLGIARRKVKAVFHGFHIVSYERIPLTARAPHTDTRQPHPASCICRRPQLHDRAALCQSGSRLSIEESLQYMAGPACTRMPAERLSRCQSSQRPEVTFCSFPRARREAAWRSCAWHA